jgi:hypothetical protein
MSDAYACMTVKNFLLRSVLDLNGDGDGDEGRKGAIE